MRRFTLGALQFSFTDKVNWNIKPMIKMKKVSFKGNKKTVTEFYGEPIMFDKLGLFVMLPAQEVVEINGYDSKCSEKTYEQLRMLFDGEGQEGYDIKCSENTYEQLRMLFDGEGYEWVSVPVRGEMGIYFRIKEATRGLKIRNADFFMGKVQVELYNPMALQGRTAVIVKIREKG